MPKESPAPKPYKIEYNADGSRKLRSIVAIISDLSQPIQDRHLKTKPADRTGTKMLTYIPWYRAIQYLDLYAPGWTSHVRYEGNPAGFVVEVAGISIPCLEGVITREATGQEKEKVTGFGDSTSNAESMALRRAAAKFGLGLYLYYDKD